MTAAGTGEMQMLYCYSSALDGTLSVYGNTSGTGSPISGGTMAITAGQPYEWDSLTFGNHVDCSFQHEFRHLHPRHNLRRLEHLHNRHQRPGNRFVSVMNDTLEEDFRAWLAADPTVAGLVTSAAGRAGAKRLFHSRSHPRQRRIHRHPLRGKTPCIPRRSAADT